MNTDKFEAAFEVWLSKTAAERRKLAERIYGDYAEAMRYRGDHASDFIGEAPIDRDCANWPVSRCLFELEIFEWCPTPENIALWQAGYDDWGGERL